MRILIELTKRHMRLFLRDRVSVFFSFLSVIIIILMYTIFLGRLQTQGLESMNDGTIPETIINFTFSKWLIASWIMAGILTVSTVTVPLGTLGALISDKYNGKIDDFYTSPIDRRILALSYLLSSWIVGFFMVMVNLLVGQIYVVLNGGDFIGFFDSIMMVGVVILSIMSFSSLFFYLSLFMKTTNAFGLLSTMVSTFIGFLGGIYIQIGLMPKTVQSIMNMLPTAHAVTLIRRIYMKEAINGFFVDQSISEYNEFKNDMGLNANIFGYTLSNFEMVLSLIAFGVLFYTLSAIKLSKSKL